MYIYRELEQERGLVTVILYTSQLGFNQLQDYFALVFGNPENEEYYALRKYEVRRMTITAGLGKGDYGQTIEIVFNTRHDRSEGIVDYEERFGKTLLLGA